MRKYLLHVLIISFVFLLAPTAQVASYAGEIEDAKEKVRKKYGRILMMQWLIIISVVPITNQASTKRR